MNLVASGGAEGLDADTIATKLGLTHSATLAALLEGELCGTLRKVPGAARWRAAL